MKDGGRGGRKRGSAGADSIEHPSNCAEGWKLGGSDALMLVELMPLEFFLGSFGVLVRRSTRSVA